MVVLMEVWQAGNHDVSNIPTYAITEKQTVPPSALFQTSSGTVENIDTFLFLEDH